jgi:hypothetical protein
MRQRLDSDVLWAADRVGRALGLLMLGCSDGKHVKLAGTLADGIQMVVVVPEHLSDGIAGQQACVMSDRVSSVEMEDLQSLLSADRKQPSGWRHLHVIGILDQTHGHILICALRVEVPACVRGVDG